MSDDRYSLDNILDEFSGNHGGPTMDINLDELLSGIDSEMKKAGAAGTDMPLTAGRRRPAPPAPAKPAAEPDPAPDIEERRMELIQREIISKDYEHKYLGQDFRDVIDEEKRRKAEKIAKAMEKRSDTAEFSPDGNAPGDARRRGAAGSVKKRRGQDKRRQDGFEEDEDEFRRKYEFLRSRGLGVQSKSERRQISAETEDAFNNAMEQLDRNPGSGRTFSEKAEDEGGGYDEAESAKPVRALTDKAGLVTFTQGDSAEDERLSKMDDPLDDYTGDSMNRLLSGYEKGSSAGNSSNTGTFDKTRGFTDIFGKLMKPDEPASDDLGSTRRINGNADLIDGMAKAKKERLSGTSHVAPIERKSISDIDLNLDGKILPNTASIPDEEIAEADMFSDLMERRKKKVDDFVLHGDEKESAEDTQGKNSEIDDFETMDDAMSILNDITRLKKTMTVRLLILLLCFGVTAYLTLANEAAAKLPDFFNMRTQPSTYVFINTIIGIAAAVVSHTAIAGGLVKMFTLQSDCDSLAAVSSISTIALSIVSGVMGTNLIRSASVHEYIPIGIAALIFNTAGKLLILDRTQRNFKYISGDSERYAVYMIHAQEQAEVFTRGALTDFPMLTTMRKTEMISDFMKTSYSADSSDRFCRIFTPIIIGAAVLIGLLGGFSARDAADLSPSDAPFVGISSFVGCISLCSCLSMMLVVNLPLQKASRKYCELQGALIGFDAIDEFSDTNSVMTDAVQLFPKGSVTLAAIKIFSDTRIDEAIVEAASLTSQSNSIMMSMFYDVIGGKTEMLNPVESYIYEDSMGLCGWINNKRILLGNRELMINHSIEGMPSPQREREYTGEHRIPVYLSISGELSAMFIIDITPVPEVAQSLRELERNGIKVILRSVDSSVTVDRMADMFEISPDTLRILPFRAHEQFEGATSYVPRQSALLACSGRFAAFSALVLGTKKLRGTIAAGIALQAISILLGILLSAMIVLLKSFDSFSVGMILLYNAIFTVIYLIIDLFRKV